MGFHEKVFLVEDDEYVAGSAQFMLEVKGHEVVTSAWNLKNAKERIQEARDAGMTVAVVDGNLGEGSRNCEDGKIISESIRAQFPEVTIIAYSAEEEEVANYGDLYIDKNPYKLAAEVTKIPR